MCPEQNITYFRRKGDNRSIAVYVPAKTETFLKYNYFPFSCESVLEGFKEIKMN